MSIRLDTAEDELFENAPIALGMASVNGQMLRANRAMANYFGYSKDEMIGKSFHDLVHPDDAVEERAHFDDMLNGIIATFAMERRFVHKSGETVWGKLNATLVRDEQSGAPRYFVAAIDDIAAKKQAEARQHLAEQELKTIAENISSVVWMATPGLERIIYVNDAYSRIWGRSKVSLYNNPRSILEAIHEYDRERVDKAIAEQHRQGHWDMRYRIVDADGKTRHIMDKGNGIYGEEGELLFLVGTATDITTEVEAKQKLERLNQLLERANAELGRHSMIEPMTKTANRDVIIAELRSAINLYHRHRLNSTLIFFDLNNFKDINDTYGHNFGDRALIAFANNILARVRKTDTFARYGGDEFLLLLQGSNAKQAEKFLRQLEPEIFVRADNGEDVQIQVATGIVQVSKSIHSVEQWVDLADQEMYRKKR